jgi:hypothetical protein
MPMHDWTRVDPNDYHTFHLFWIASIATALNNNRLPQGYYAMADHTTPPVIPDVVTLSAEDATPASSEPASDGPGGVAVESPPRTTIAVTEPGRKKKVSGRRRVAIRHARSRQIVAVIEIVSPSNKAKKPEFADLVQKSVQLLRQGVHVLLIDPFPPTARDPSGVHAAVWKVLTGKSFAPPDGKSLTLASYAAQGGNTFSAFVEPLAVGDRLPDMPLFLTPKAHVPTPLEETYQAAWQGYPAPLRKVVEGQ